MICSQCQGIEEMFNPEYTSRELTRYRKHGADKSTRLLIEAIKQAGVQGMSLLDIGGGVGAIQHDLLAAGVQQATDVDASAGFLESARVEARRRGYAEKVSFQHGNFVELAAQIPPSDIVTLDRVLCCYPEMEKMVTLSVERARRLYGLVFPRNTWWTKLGFTVINWVSRLRKSQFRGYNHSPQAIEQLVTSHGFQRRAYYQTAIWHVIVYSR